MAVNDFRSTSKGDMWLMAVPEISRTDRWAGLMVSEQKLRSYPRIRYMGSKYKIMPQLLEVFAKLEFTTALDAFSGSGVVAYGLKALGKKVTANDFLNFPAEIARATVENSSERITREDLDILLSPNEDGRDFVQRTFRGLYFPEEDHAFIDQLWSHLHHFSSLKRSMILAAICQAAARKQPRGVFTVTDVRYDDGRRFMRMPLRELFLLAVEEYNNTVFDNGQANKALHGDVFELDPSGYDLVYLDPPYAPPRDDNDYIKRYHFLEGMSLYWQGVRIMENTITKKIEKRYTPFAYKSTVRQALETLFDMFRRSIIVLSYGSNSYPPKEVIYDLLKAVKRRVEIIEVPHRYSFGTHTHAKRREVREYIFVAID